MRNNNRIARVGMKAVRRLCPADMLTPFTEFAMCVEGCPKSHLCRPVTMTSIWIPMQLLPAAFVVFDEYRTLVQYGGLLAIDLGGKDAITVMLRGLKPFSSISQDLADSTGVEAGMSPESRGRQWVASARKLAGQHIEKWYDLLFHIAGSPAFSECSAEGFARLHEAVMEVVRDFYASNKVPTTRGDCQELVLMLPIWIRKIRARYMSALRLKVFCDMFEVIVRSEEGCVFGSNQQSNKAQPTAVLLDKDLLNFFVAIPGRKEVALPRAEQWSQTLRHCAFIMPVLVKVHRTDVAVLDAFRFSLNVIAYGSAAAERQQLVELCDVMFHAIGSSVSCELLDETAEHILRWYLKKAKTTAFLMLPSTLLGGLIVSLRHVAAAGGFASSDAAVNALRSPLCKVEDAVGARLAVQFSVSVLDDVLSGVLNASAQSREVATILAWLDEMIGNVIPGGSAAVPLVVDRLAEFSNAGRSMTEAARFKWSCADCGSSNTAVAARCYACTVVEADRGIAVGQDERNKTCREDAARAAGYWVCSGCATVSAVPEECSGCGQLCPYRKIACRSCGMELDPADRMCSRCGTLTAGHENATLKICSRCGHFCADGDQSACCCEKTAPFVTVSHFHWLCGCGKDCSPASLACQYCTTQGGGTAGGAPPSLTCPHCSASVRTDALTKWKTTAGKAILVHKCPRCSRLHPRDETLVSRRLAHCLACGLAAKPIVSCQDGSLSCRGCGGCDFAPGMLVDLPWTCHECGAVHGSRGDVACRNCEGDRVSPALFSEHSEWACPVCGIESARGFACPRCHNLHPSVNPADVSLWRCATCRSLNPSWSSECRKGCAGSARDGNAELLRMAPWRCAGCAFYNAPSNLTHCFQCRSTRPPLLCSLCNTPHVTLECPPALRDRKLAALQKELLEAAEASDDDGVSGGAEVDDAVFLPFSTDLDVVGLSRAW